MGVKTRDELEIKLNTEYNSILNELLLKLGFKPVLAIAKKRIVYKYRGIEASLDELIGVGWFLELELQSDEDREVFSSLVKKLVVEYGLKPVEKTYLEICIETNKCRGKLD